MQDGIIPVKETLLNRRLRSVLCNSFGFGGNDSSLVFMAFGEHGSKESDE